MRGVNPSIKVKANTNQAYVRRVPDSEREGILPSASSKYEIEVESNKKLIIITTRNTRLDGSAFLTRILLKGRFSYKKNGAVSTGSIRSIYSQNGLNGSNINESQRWAIKRLNFSKSKDWNTLNREGIVFGVDYEKADDLQTRSLYGKYFSGRKGSSRWWQFEPFAPSLLKDSRSKRNSSKKDLKIDSLTGNFKQNNDFLLVSPPKNGNSIDKITNFSVINQDTLQISLSHFNLKTGSFATANKQSELSKLLATDANFIYNQQKGQFIFNANGARSGHGDSGGIFAMLSGSPLLPESSIRFV